VGYAVHDLDEGMARMRAVGVEKWGTMEAELPCLYRGEEVTIGLRAAYARWGSIYLELVQPTTGPSTPRTFLDERGEGIYHLGYWVDDLAATTRRAEDLGFNVDLAIPSNADHRMAVYLDAGRSLGVHIELVNASVRQMIEDLVTKVEQG
jgi:methylmalonyl-CoA/ethylmalonyl-CoA epimerase